MRTLPFITIGKILQELEAEGLSLQPISFKRREKDIKGFPIVQNKPNEWRRYTRTQANKVKSLLKKHYMRNAIG